MKYIIVSIILMLSIQALAQNTTLPRESVSTKAKFTDIFTFNPGETYYNVLTKLHSMPNTPVMPGEQFGFKNSFISAFIQKKLIVDTVETEFYFKEDKCDKIVVKRGFTVDNIKKAYYLYNRLINLVNDFYAFEHNAQIYDADKHQIGEQVLFGKVSEYDYSIQGREYIQLTIEFKGGQVVDYYQVELKYNLRNYSLD